MNLVLLGPPGAGKGTQGVRLSEFLGAPRIATGDMLREAIDQGSDLGHAARGFMDRGELVPDEVVIGIVRDRIGLEDCAGGFILDGFPRNVEQGRALDAMLDERSLAIDRCLLIAVDDEEVVRRLCSRRICENCGHITQRTAGDERPCEKCGEARLIQRSDDKEETIRARLQVYRKETEPLADYYRSRGQLAEVPGSGTVDEVFQHMKDRVAEIES